jgi:hypothetical protein
MMKRVVLGALLVLALAPAAARADFKSGKYSYSSGSSTNCGLCSISFKASQSKVSKLKLSIYTASAACTDGLKLVVSASDVKSIFGSVKISISDAKFGTTLTSASGNTKLKIKGKLKGSKASGSVRLTGPDANDASCDTGKLKFTAKRKS